MISHLYNLGYLGASLRKLLARQPADCRLMFRYPKDSPGDSFSFYQDSYREGCVTGLPDKGELASLLHHQVPRPDWDFTPRLAVLKALGTKPGQKILDFGCSWGYGTHQLRRAGYDAMGFEISAPRGGSAGKTWGSPLPATGRP